MVSNNLRKLVVSFCIRMNSIDKEGIQCKAVISKTNKGIFTASDFYIII